MSGPELFGTFTMPPYVFDAQQRRVVCAAVRDATGIIVCGTRHFDRSMVDLISHLMTYTLPWEQGFIDQHGVFMTREEAWRVAMNADQIRRRVGGDEGRLFSENLY